MARFVAQFSIVSPARAIPSRLPLTYRILFLFRSTTRMIPRLPSIRSSSSNPPPPATPAPSVRSQSKRSNRPSSTTTSASRTNQPSQSLILYLPIGEALTSSVSALPVNLTSPPFRFTPLASLPSRRAAIAIILQKGHMQTSDALSHSFKMTKNPARGAGDVRPGSHR